MAGSALGLRTRVPVQPPPRRSVRAMVEEGRAMGRLALWLYAAELGLILVGRSCDKLAAVSAEVKARNSGG